jgi:hypothetical protein
VTGVSATPFVFGSSSIIDTSRGELLRLVELTLFPSISMLPRFENSILFVDNNSSPKELVDKLSSDRPVNVSSVGDPSFTDVADADLDGFSEDNHRLSFPVPVPVSVL